MTGDSPSFSQQIFKSLSNTIVLLAAVAAITGVVVQVRNPAPRLQGLLVNPEKLTSEAGDSKIHVTYRFVDKEVKALWRVRLDLRHVGGRTIIGSGPQRNIIDDHIPVTVARDFDLLDFDVTQNDLNATVQRSFDSENQFYISFEQWRRDESISIVLYLEDKTGSGVGPGAFTSGRSIADGEITYALADDIQNKPKRPLIDFLPEPIAFSARLFVTLVCVGLALAVWTAASSVLKDARQKARVHRWRVRFRQRARDHMKALVGDTVFQLIETQGFKISRDQLQNLAHRPASEIWGQFDGEVPESLDWLDKHDENPVANFIAVWAVLIVSIVMIGCIVSVTWKF